MLIRKACFCIKPIRWSFIRFFVSPEVTAATHTDDDVALDRTSLLAYLEGENGTGLAAAPLAKAAIVQAYVAEYGRAPDEQSCLNFLLFIHADRRSKFTPFGVSSDERYHVVDGNDRIGSLAWRASVQGATLAVNTNDPAAYVRVAWTQFNGAAAMQLVYTFWFPARPAAHTSMFTATGST